MERKSDLPYVNVPETIHQPPARKNVETVIRKVADRILSETNFTFRYLNKSHESPDNLPANEEVSLACGHVDWKYWNGVINIGLLRLGEELEEEKYMSHCRDFFNFAFSNLEYFQKLFQNRVPNALFHQYFRMDRLDDCGALGASLIETFWKEENHDLTQRIDETAAYISEKQDRLEDGTFCRKRFNRTTLWADDLYMSVPFLVRYAELSGNEKYLEDAILQVKNFHHRLFSEQKGLYHHCWYKESDAHGVAHWGRANGWVAMAVCDLLEFMPVDHPEKKNIIRILFRQITGFSRYQAASGMWRQLLDKEDAWEESSVTAMFSYAIAKSVNNGWIEDIYSSLAVNGWKGLIMNISSEGELNKVSTGFNIKQDLPFYYNIPVETGGAHGLGAVLLAGTEMLKLKEYRDCLWC
jgi:rhamnogalacturonyl hydrolase YesR